MHVGMNPDELEQESNYDIKSAFGDKQDKSNSADD